MKRLISETTPDLEHQPPPYPDEADVHGDFGDKNPGVQW